jgi:integrase/recombinase XerD
MAMTALAPTLEAFFTDRLMTQRRASPRTVAAYRDTFRLLLTFAETSTGKSPSRLDVADLDAALIGAFLTHLEAERGNSIRTRNARLAAIRSLFHFATFAHPEHAALIQRVLAIPAKRHERAVICYLTPAQTDALLAAPARTRWIGRRDHAMLVLAVQTGLRVSELTQLTRADLELGTGAHVRCHGKGRKQRATPLTRATVDVLSVWLAERAGNPGDPLFPTRRGGSLSTDAVGWLLTKYATSAAMSCPSLTPKKISPHVLRHTAAMNLLQAGVEISVIALWLGHESTTTTMVYLHSDLALKERALARTAPPDTTPGRYQPPDTLLAFLEAL